MGWVMDLSLTEVIVLKTFKLFIANNWMVLLLYLMVRKLYQKNTKNFISWPCSFVPLTDGLVMTGFIGGIIIAVSR